jgi:hypothetical protein
LMNMWFLNRYQYVLFYRWCLMMMMIIIMMIIILLLRSIDCNFFFYSC